MLIPTGERMVKPDLFMYSNGSIFWNSWKRQFQYPSRICGLYWRYPPKPLAIKWTYLNPSALSSVWHTETLVYTRIRSTLSSKIKQRKCKISYNFQNTHLKPVPRGGLLDHCNHSSRIWSEIWKIVKISKLETYFKESNMVKIQG